MKTFILNVAGDILPEDAALIAASPDMFRMLKNLIDAHYGSSFHHIGDGDGIPEAEADEIRKWAEMNMGHAARAKGEA